MAAQKTKQLFGKERGRDRAAQRPSRVTKCRRAAACTTEKQVARLASELTRAQSSREGSCRLKARARTVGDATHSYRQKERASTGTRRGVARGAGERGVIETREGDA